MSKRPSFQFYPSDWRREHGLRLCSIAARGLWIDMMMIMHDGEPYGHLTCDGEPLLPEELARLVGEGGPTIKRLLAELEKRNVFSRTDQGVIFSRRMVRDEDARERRAAGGQAGAEHGAKGAEHGAKGGRPRKDKTLVTENERGDKKPPSEPPPSSSSASPPAEGLVGASAPTARGRSKSSRSAGVDIPLPADWKPNLGPAAQAIVDRWPPGLLERDELAFRSHAAANGRLTKDWDAAFRTWITKTDQRRIDNDRSSANQAGPTAHRNAGPRPDGVGAAFHRRIAAERSRDDPGDVDQGAGAAGELPLAPARIVHRG